MVSYSTLKIVYIYQFLNKYLLSGLHK